MPNVTCLHDDVDAAGHGASSTDVGMDHESPEVSSGSEASPLRDLLYVN